VHFIFSIDSEKGNKVIAPPYLKIADEKINLPSFRTYQNNKLKFTFGQIKEMITQPLTIHTFDETTKVEHIKIMIAQNRLKKSFENLKDPVVLEQYESFYPDDKLFYLDYFPSLERNKVDLIFQLDANDNIFKKVNNEFSWGEHPFSFKDPIIKLTKKELTQLFESHDIKDYLGNAVERISGIRFLFNEKENIIYGRQNNYSVKEMMSDPIFKEQFDKLENGDILNIINLKSKFIQGGLVVLIDEQLSNKTPLFKLAEGKGKIRFNYTLPQAVIYRNYNLKSLLTELLDLKPHEIRFNTSLDNSKFINLTYIPVDGIDPTKDILERIKTKYPFTIKKKIVEKESWFLSGGDAKKLEQFRQQNLPTNLTLFTEDNTKKGIETLGPVKFDWFATNYFKSKYQIDIINLTDFKGKYVFPLDTKDFKTLQQQLKRDFDLELKKQRRSIEIKEIAFE